MLMILKMSSKKRKCVGHDRIIVTYDQAKFTLDADVRRCGAFIGETPIVYKNGSKESISIGGAYSSTNEFHFYQMPWQVKENVLENIKAIHQKFPKLFLILDKATWNKNKLVENYLQENDVPYMFFPTGASDLNHTEECWKQTREEITANKSHNSKEQLFENLKAYWEKNPFQHNVLNYLLP